MRVFRNLRKSRIVAGALVLILFSLIVGAAGFHRFVVKALPGFLKDLAKSHDSELSFQSVDVRWKFFIPEMCLYGLRFSYGDATVQSESSCVSLKVVESLTSSAPVLKRVSISGFVADFSKLDFGKNLSSPDVQANARAGASSTDLDPGVKYLRVWKKIVQMLSDFELLNGHVLFPLGNGGTYELKVARMTSSIELQKGVFAIEVQSDPNATSTITIDAEIGSPFSLAVDWSAEVNKFNAPLLYLDLPAKFYRIEKMVADGKLSADSLGFNFTSTVKEFLLHDGSFKGGVTLKSDRENTSYDVSVNNIEGDALEIISLLDPKWMGVETVGWIQSSLTLPRVAGGKVSVVGDALSGLRDLKVGFQAKIEEVSFSKEWPTLKQAEALFEINQTGMRIKEINGTSSGLKVAGAEFAIPRFADENLVSKIALRIGGTGEAVLKYLMKSPLATDVLPIVKSTEFSAKRVDADLKISLPLAPHKGSAAEVKVDAKLSGIKLNLDAGSLGLNDGRSELHVHISLPESSPAVIASTGSFYGIPTGRIQFSKIVHGKYRFNTNEPWYGLRLALSENAVTAIPSSTGVTANLQYLKGALQVTPLEQQKPHHGKVKHVGIDPRNIPLLDLSIERLHLLDADFGKIFLKTANTLSGMKVSRLEWVSPRSDLKVNSGSWTIDKSGNEKTSFEGVWRANDVGRLLRVAGVTSDLEGGEGELKFDLNWSGSVGDFALAELNGVVTPSLKNAQLNSAQGILLKLADLFTLNLLQAYKKGAALKSLSGTLHFDSGEIKMSPLLVDLGSVVTRLNGTLDIEEETIDSRGEMNAEIGKAVGAVTLGAFNPVAGVVYFAREKPLIDLSFLNGLTEFSYKMQGSWHDPKVSEVRYKPFGL